LQHAGGEFFLNREGETTVGRLRAALTDLGLLVLGTKIDKIFNTTEPYIWALTYDTKGTLWAGSGNKAILYRIDKKSGDAVEASDVKDTTQPATALQHVAAAFEQSGRSADVTAQPRTQAAAQTTETATVHTESSTKPAAAPLKDISMQVTQSGEEKVEIRVVQQSGEVHVAVRTGDADLTHGLRQGLTELVGKLEDNGYRADTWRPAASTAATASLSQSQDSQGASGHSHYGDSSNRQNGSQQNGGQQNQNAFNRPRWVEALESGATGEGEPTGETNGIGN